jgi:heptosyltransferase-2
MVPFYAALADAPAAPAARRAASGADVAAADAGEAAYASARHRAGHAAGGVRAGRRIRRRQALAAGHFAALAGACANRPDPHGAGGLLGSPRTSETCDEIGRPAGRAACSTWPAQTSLDEAIALIARRAVVSNDSGLLHIASALNRPVVAMYGPTDPDHAPPFSDVARVAVAAAVLRAVPQRECPLGHHDCMTKLAYLARLAFGEGDYRVFYDDVEAARAWLSGEG